MSIFELFFSLIQLKVFPRMPHTSTVAVRFADIDAMGHVNNATFLNYFEQARMQFFHDSIGGKWDWKRDGIVLARNEVDYLRPLFLQENVLIDTTVEAMGTKSLTISYEVYDQADTTRVVYARGKSVIVCFDYHAGKTTVVPEVWKEKFSTED